MPPEVHDLRSTIIPKSDQLNSEQLLGGPLVITVTDVRVGGGEEQPVSVYHDTDPARPFKPCKTMRKVLILAWGPDGRKWVGRSMELYCDPSVKFGGEAVGGIRISKLTDIPKEIKVSLTATKGRKALHEIGRLVLSGPLQDVLAAIGAANDGPSLRKARAKAQEELTKKSELDIAFAAYTKRVEALKEKAAAGQQQTVDRSTAQIDPTDRPDSGAEPRDGGAPDSGEQEHPKAAAGGPVVTYEKAAERIERAQEREIAELVVDEARTSGVPSDQLSALGQLVDEKFPVA